MKLTSADCRKCGLCCVALYDQEAFCDVTEADCKRLGPRFVRLHVLGHSPMDMMLSAMDGAALPYAAIATKWRTQRAGPLKGVKACACVCLRGSLMHRVSCRVYDKRPSVCRNAVKPGDRTCLALRRDALELRA